MDLTYLEITRQYETLSHTIELIENNRQAIGQFYRNKKPASIVFVGSGSSFFLAQSAEAIARHFGFHAFSLPAGDAMVNFNLYKTSLEGALAVIISRSGNTTEILRTAEEMKKAFGTPVVGLTCVEDSELGAVSDLCLKMPWAFDESVCQTGTVTNLYAAAALLTAGFAGSDRLFEEMKRAVAAGDDFLKENEAAFKGIAGREWNKVVVLADSEIAGLACEGALAFKEIARTDSNFYHVLDVRHGPMVMIDQKTLVIAALKPDNKDYQLKLIEDLRQKDAILVVCTDTSYDRIPGAALHIRHEDFGNIAEGLPLINIAQMIAYFRAVLKGLDPGNPEGLDAWIKL